MADLGRARGASSASAAAAAGPRARFRLHPFLPWAALGPCAVRFRG